ncbi:MAG: right-handed parallel beta-helix repeat-containing protein [Deltaproteobacteria bacterium]|nr:right-handed parallel beta-helix repeat-containing protein [Deltaproteobacteria bacterium]
MVGRYPVLPVTATQPRRRYVPSVERWGGLLLLAAILIDSPACRSGVALLGDANPPETVVSSDESSDESIADAVADGVEDTPPIPDGPDSVGPSCPVWATTTPRPTPGDGTEAMPFFGLREALNGRGDCDRVRLLGGPDAYSARVDLTLEEGEALVIEADPGADAPPRLASVDGEAGLAVRGRGSLVLEGLAFAGGQASRGGCLDAEVSRIELRRTTWNGCESSGDGGAVFVLADYVELTDSAFEDCMAVGEGGGAALAGRTDSATVVVRGSAFRRNEAAHGAGLALQVISVDVRIEGSRFVANRASESGAAVFGNLGGVMTGNLFVDNIGGPSGGAVVGNGGWPAAEVVNNVFLRNRAASVTTGGTSCCDPAGALQLRPAYGTIRNNLFIDNVSEPDAEYGQSGPGALMTGDGEVRVLNNTFVGNSSSRSAHLGVSRVVLTGNIFWGGEGDAGTTSSAGLPGDAVVEYCDSFEVPEPPFIGFEVGVGNVAMDPLFVDRVACDFRLRADSPVRDASDPSASFRDVDGTRGDMGAFGGPAGDWVPLTEEGP